MIEVLHRNRFREVADATAERISGNAWTVRIPTDSRIHGQIKRAPTAEGWDGAVFFIDGRETEPGLGSGTRRGFVEISVYAL